MHFIAVSQVSKFLFAEIESCITFHEAGNSVAGDLLAARISHEISQTGIQDCRFYRLLKFGGVILGQALN